MKSSSTAGLNGPETPLDTDQSTHYCPGTEGDPELVKVQDTMITSLRALAMSTRRRATLLENLLPEFDKAQERYSRHSGSHVRLPKGCTWTQIKVWMLKAAGLEISLRQLERELEEIRNPGRKATRKAAAAARKQQKNELLKLADAIEQADRNGQDVSAAIEAYRRARSGNNTPAENLTTIPSGTAAAGAEPNPANTGKDLAPAPEPCATTLAPAMVAQADSAPVSQTSTSSPGGTTAAVVADTKVVTIRAALELTPRGKNRPRKATINQKSSDNAQTAATAQKASPPHTAIAAVKPGDAAGAPKLAAATEKEPIAAAELPAPKVRPSTCVSIDSRRHVGGSVADVQVPASLARPQSAAGEPTGSAKEFIFCVSLEPAPEGGHKPVAPAAALTRIRKARKWHKYLLSGTVDLFHPSVSFKVIREILSSVMKAQESEFTVITGHPERMHEYAAWEKSNYDGWYFPINLTLVVMVQSTLELERLDAFAKVKHELKSVSFAGFRSDSAHPLAPGDLLPRLIHCEPREILVERNPARGAQGLTPADADCLALIAGQPSLSEYVVIL